MKNIFAVILLALAVATQSCKKEDDEPVQIKEEPVVIEEGCKEYDYNCDIGPFWKPVGTFHNFPRFNPNNGNEFLYVRSSSIYKHNLLTKQSSLVAERVRPVGPPDWSKTGWIVFSDISWNVWKVRDDGTGLQQLSFGVDDQFPYFNPAGDKIIYGSHFQNTYKMLVIDLNGNKLDTLCSTRFGSCLGWGVSSWMDNDRILRRTHSGQGTDGELSFYNYATKQDETPLFTYIDENAQEMLDYKAISQTKVLYSMSRKGLIEFNANTKEHRIIKPYCDNRLYNFFDISPDKTRILAEKETNTFVTNCLYDQCKTIVIMNIDGSNEQEVPLP